LLILITVLPLRIPNSRNSTKTELIIRVHILYSMRARLFTCNDTLLKVILQCRSEHHAISTMFQ